MYKILSYISGFGLFGNSVSIPILGSMIRHNNNNYNVYLACLCLSDMAFLITMSISLTVTQHGTENLEYSDKSITHVNCTILYFWGIFFKGFSMCLITIICFERYRAICKPLEALKISKKRKYKVGILADIC